MLVLDQNTISRINHKMLNFVVALDCEASPLVNHYCLERDRGVTAFKLFRADGIVLVVSGIGRERAARAAAFLRTSSEGGSEGAWLNVGIGGHAFLPIGTCLLAHQITERASGKSWHPRIAFEPPCPTAAVSTVDVVEKEFPDDSVYEMEASGFCSVAFGASAPDRIHCLKVVSDNRDAPFQEARPAHVSDLIHSHLPAIHQVAAEALSLNPVS